MAKIDKINAFGTMYNVAANSNDVAYNGDDADNVEEAIDELYRRTEGGGGGDATVVSAAPVWKDKLKILFIANSFVQRSFSWELVNVLNGINAAYPDAPITWQNLKIEQYFRGGESMAGFLERLEDAPHYQEYYKKIEYSNGAWSLAGTAKGLQDAIEGEHWDVIILQAWPKDGSTEDVRNYSTFSAALSEWISQIHTLCPNPDVCIGFNMIWPCKATFTKATFDTYFASICNATKQMVADSGVNLIIPSGTAMANAVATNTFNGANTHFLMRDMVHAGKGVAEYIIACTIYEAVLAPVLKRSMMDITAVPPENTGDQGDNTYSQANITVTPENLSLCHEIALRAVSDMYHVDDTIDPIQP